MRRYILSRRWIPWHVFCAVLVVALLAMGVWQARVSFASPDPGEPLVFNLRNFVYAWQWWIFAGFGAWFWFRFMRDQRDAELAQDQAAAESDKAEAAAESDSADQPGSQRGPKPPHKTALSVDPG